MACIPKTLIRTRLSFQIRKIPDLPYPEAVFDGSFFRQNPVPFYRLVREIYPERLEPTLTHRFFKLLDNKGILTRVFTQNIDALEFLPHLDPEKVVEVFKKIELPFFRIGG